MTGLDVLFWASLFLGGSYLLLSVGLGGLSQLAAQANGSADVGDLGDTGHVGDTGDLGDLGHADPGADIGHTDVGGDVGGPDGGGDGHLGDSDAAHADHDSPPGLKLLSFLSPVLTSGFLSGFGGAGVLARLAKLPAVPSVLWAAAGGVSLYYVGWWIIHDVFGGSQASSHTRQDELTGRTGLVMAPIIGSRPGMVCYTIAGARQTIAAITEDGIAIPVGATVVIRRVAGKKAVVSRVGGDEAPHAQVKGVADA